MALNDENGFGTTMLVQPANGTNNSGIGGFGDGNGFWILLLFLLLGNNGWGGWGMGGNGGFAADSAVMYPWMNQSNQINNGFRDQMLNSQVSGIQSSITSGFGDVATQLCGGFAGVNAAIANGFAQNEIAANARQIADMQQSFAAQTATLQGFNGLQNQFAQCCCDNRAGLADVKYTIATENCADRAAVSDGIRDLMAANNASTQRILDQLCADKIEAKNDTIAQLRSELLYARGQASQDVQTAAIQAGQRALANEVEQYVAPRPIPAYYVTNPACCQTMGCGVA